MGEAGKRATAGLEVRLVNLPANAGAGMGVFQNLHDRPSAAALVEELREGARRTTGPRRGRSWRGYHRTAPAMQPNCARPWTGCVVRLSQIMFLKARLDRFAAWQTALP